MTDAVERKLNRFLAEVEQRAFALTVLKIRDRDEAMDIVQDSMLRLVRKYSGRPPDEWTPLFYRILANRTRDLQRRRQVRNRVMSFFGSGSDEDEYDPLAAAPDRSGEEPDGLLEAEETHSVLSAAIRQLPERQREAFMLRSMEGFDVATTAAAMGCSEGSVKTHYSRALTRLRGALDE